MQLKTIISKNKDNIAFIVGNGINRYPNNPKALSWDDLLIKLWDKFSFTTISEVPKGISITEFYDLLDIESCIGKSTNVEIQKEVCRLLESWPSKPHHKKFLEKARTIHAPVLTTNFDLVLPNALKLKQHYFYVKKSFSRYYPWTTYFGENKLDLPTDDFGIWYINGLFKYPQSIRLGLTHYMGNVEKVRSYLHKGEDSLFSGKDHKNWKGNNTWLHIIFNRSLCIFGLSLEENEIFLRWLLIERAKYFRKFPDRKNKGWYIINKPDKLDKQYLGKKYFFEHIGFEVIETDDYDSIYKSPWEQ